MKRLLPVAVGLALGTSVGALVLLGIIPVPFGPLAEARAASEKSRPPVTVMYPTKERVVNLTDTAQMRYLKAQVTLEFVDQKQKEPPKGDEVRAQQEKFAKDMAAHAAIIEDRLTLVLSARSSAELLGTSGKERLKQELIDEINGALHGGETAVNVYFPVFIIQ